MNVESSRFSLELLQIEWGVVLGAPSGGPGGRRVTASAGWQQLVTAPVGWLARPPPLVSGVVVRRGRAPTSFRCRFRPDAVAHAAIGCPYRGRIFHSKKAAQARGAMDKAASCSTVRRKSKLAEAGRA
jgi:hypothetical protein